MRGGEGGGERGGRESRRMNVRKKDADTEEHLDADGGEMSFKLRNSRPSLVSLRDLMGNYNSMHARF